MTPARLVAPRPVSGPIARVAGALPRLLLVAAIVSCAETAPAFDASSVQVVVELRDYQVVPSAATMKAGTARIGVRNRGAQPHDLTILRTQTAPDRLPVDGSSAKAREDGLVARQPELRAGGSARLDVTLEPGAYVLICNVPGHYQLGMRTALTVE